MLTQILRYARMHIFQTLFIVAFLSYNNSTATPVITFFARYLPNPEKISKKLAKPGNIAKHMLEGINQYSLHAASGIFSTYAGYLAVSDKNGQTLFPRRHLAPLLYIVVTNKIVPIPMLEHTIHHWEMNQGTPTAMYKLEQQQDATTGAYFWNTVQEETIPDIIPLESIVIIAKPHNILIPVGTSITQQSPNLVLPDIYVRKGIALVANSLYIINLASLFSPVQLWHKKEEKRYEIIIQS